jgi:hypothetical protein
LGLLRSATGDSRWSYEKVLQLSHRIEDWHGKKDARDGVAAEVCHVGELGSQRREGGCSADMLMLIGAREGGKVLYRNIVSEVFDCHRSFAIVPGIDAEKIGELYIKR